MILKSILKNEQFSWKVKLIQEFGVKSFTSEQIEQFATLTKKQEEYYL